jgi:hypothetical protein
MSTSPESISRGQPHARYRHLFVVGRIWKASLTEADQLTLDDLTLTKAFFSEEEANAEAARLNEMNGERWCYFARVARLVPESLNDDN